MATLLDIEPAMRLAIREAEAQGAGDCEAYVSLTLESEVSIENNDLKQAKSQQAGVIGVRVFVDGALGFYSVNSLEREKVKEAAARAVRMARVSPKDRFNLMPKKRKVARVRGIYDRNAEGFGARDAAKYAAEMLHVARGADGRVSVDSGNFTAALATQAVGNSNGVMLSEKLSAFSWSIMGMAIDGADVSSFDVQSGSTHSVKGIDVAPAAREFSQTVVNSLGAKKMDSNLSGATMILTPAAAAELVEEVVSYSVNSDSVQKKSSRFAGRLGKKVASPLLTVVDDPTDPAGLAAASFDREGVPHRRNTVIEKGVLKKFLYNTYTAAKGGVSSTGNASGSTSSPPSVSTTNFVVAPGRPSFDALVAETKQGVMVSRFSGNVNPVNGDFSGVVKGGRLIRNGELGHAVREVMVAGNVFECLENLTGVSRERKAIYSSILPYMRFEGVSFTGG
ncbi:metallopeptidase TldD-related protein [Nitrososphaera sp.]|uniref:TldD/PmbA family protein n=1 Tax=Nitrososphaera sp. TaxID=1971748 RepID=UPI00307CF3B3